jgi:anthranilate phosphoribosyltransferase
MSYSYQTIQSIMTLMIQGQKIPVSIFRDLMVYFTSGLADNVEIAGFLKVFSDFPITADYLIAAIDVLRLKMVAVSLPHSIDAIDCCGTGGDNLSSLNVSTAVAFFLADYGIKVAKHGNRSVTSQSGSADILEKLNYPIKIEPQEIVQQIEKTGLTFMFAPYFHPALKHVALARKSLEKRTIFNILGPLLNPAKVKRQLIGVYDFKLAEEIAKTLLYFGCQKAMIVNSSEGADELTLSGDNHICYVENNAYYFDKFNVQQVGIENQPINAIKGGGVDFNTTEFKNALKRQSSAYYNTILINSAAGLWVADKVHSIQEGFMLLKKQTAPIDLNRYIY